MLSIFWGDMEDVTYGPVWFKYNYDLKWFEDPLVQQMLEAVDRSRYIAGGVIDSPVLGPIPPERLSGGLKTLIMIYKMPEKVFDATSCGPNCAEWLLKIGEKEDITVNLRYIMPLRDFEPFQIRIANSNSIISTAKEYVLSSLDYLN